MDVVCLLAGAKGNEEAEPCETPEINTLQFHKKDTLSDYCPYYMILTSVVCLFQEAGRHEGAEPRSILIYPTISYIKSKLHYGPYNIIFTNVIYRV